MPTYEVVARFWQDWNKLTADQQRRVRQAVERFVEDLRRGHGFRPGLRVKGIQGADGMFEMTWAADDGRATFHYGEPQSPNEPHIVWRRIGTHDIFKAP
jgi:hypothetical protein